MSGGGSDPRTILAAEFPELPIETVEPLGEGWDHVAYLVNGELVFRLPWELVEGTGPATPRAATAEVGLLRAVAGRLPVAVPEPCFVAGDASWFGYRYIAGPSIDDDRDRWVSPASRRSLVELIVDVAVAIEEAVPVDAGRALGLEVLRSVRHDAAGAAAALDNPLLSPATRALGAWAVEVYAERWEAAAQRRLATLHADLGLDHWLLDAGGQVHALIDWSDACIAPPEHQLSTLMWHIPDLAVEAASAYADRTAVDVDTELLVADGVINALDDLTELVAEGDDPEGVQRCVTFLERWAARR